MPWSTLVDALEARAGIDARLRERRELRFAVLDRALELHEDEVPDLHPAAAVGAGLFVEEREVAGPSPLKKWISVHGPHGPVSPICQKLSFIPMPMIRSSEKPVTFFQIARASSSAGDAAFAAEDGDAQAVFGNAEAPW